MDVNGDISGFTSSVYANRCKEQLERQRQTGTINFDQSAAEGIRLEQILYL